jgi:hypothetical protein
MDRAVTRIVPLHPSTVLYPDTMLYPGGIEEVIPSDPVGEAASVALEDGVDGATGLVLDQVDEPAVHKSVILTLVLGTVALVALKRRRRAG